MTEKTEQTICKRCVMDTSADITFDENGYCNYCNDYFENKKKIIQKGKLKEVMNMIKEGSKDRSYDALLGISGGVDSSYIAYLAKKHGLKVLLVSFNDHYNVKEADENIKRVVEKTGFDFYSYTVNWEELKDLQLAYLKAGVLNPGVPIDHAIVAFLYRTTAAMNIKYILWGVNYATEGIEPSCWSYMFKDLRNLKAIHKRFGTVKLKYFPTMSLKLELYYRFIKGIKPISILNYIDYNKDKAKEVLKKEFGWKDYGLKHFESYYPMFLVSCVLPRRYGIDKRKSDFSTLICSGQMTREEALKKLKRPMKKECKKAKKIVLKKWGLSEKKFKDLMNLPPRDHREFPSNEWIYKLLTKIRHWVAF